MAIPQDIVYNFIAALGDDKASLKQCALVCSSFLLPSRKPLFSQISLGEDKASQRLYQCLVQNPVLQSFVRSIAIVPSQQRFAQTADNTSLPAILRLSFCSIERLSIDFYLWTPTNWNDLSGELKDAISNIIHSSTLKTLRLKRIINVPTTLFLNVVQLREMVLDSLTPHDFDAQQSSQLTPVTWKEVATTAVIEQCVWCFWKEVCVATTPISVPFMSHLRYFEIIAAMRNFDILSILMRSLRLSLTSPATLEHIKFKIWFRDYWNNCYFDKFCENLRGDAVWGHLDSITTHPTGSRLQRVDIDIKYPYRSDRYASESDNDRVLEAVFDRLPLLHDKGILFVNVTLWHGTPIG